MRHTFLFEEGVWYVSGFYSDYRGRIVSIKGETRITHSTQNVAFFTNEDRLILELESDRAVEVKNKYLIKPFEQNRDYTSWTMDNIHMGRLFGKFVIAGDSIISTFVSGDAAYRGTEILIMVDENSYLNRGCLFRKDSKISSWWVELRRIR